MDWKVIAEENGIPYGNFRRRIREQGWSPEEAATKPLLIKKVRTKEYNKWRKKAEQNGMNPSTYRNRVDDYGFSPKEAATKPLQKKRSDREWIKKAQENGIKYGTYCFRVDEMFWSPEDASSIPPMEPEETIRLAGEQLRIYREIEAKRIFDDENRLFTVTKEHLKVAERNGITEGAVKGRVYERGWTVQDAITIPARKAPENPGGYYDYLEEAFKNDLSESMFRDRVLKLGWDLEEAAKIPPISPKERTRADKEWIELALEKGLEYHVYWSRVHNGWTPEEAATTPLLPKGQHLNEERRQNSLEAFKEFKKG